MDRKEFPKMLYLKGDVSNYKIVESSEEEDALGADWIDAPIDPADLDMGDRPAD